MDPQLWNWILTTFAGLAFSGGAYFFKELAGQVKSLRGELQAMATKLAAFEAQRLEHRLDSFEERLRTVERGT